MVFLNRYDLVWGILLQNFKEKREKSAWWNGLRLLLPFSYLIAVRYLV